jgi:hypothetical protein
LKNRYLSFLPTGSSVLPMLLCLPIATVIGVSQTEAVGAQSLGNPEAPFTEEELEPVEEDIEMSIPDNTEETENFFNLWSEDEYDVFQSDDFAEIEGYETNVYDEVPGPADGEYDVYREDAEPQEGVVNNDPFDINESDDALNIYEDNDLYDDDANDLYDVHEGLGDDSDEIDNTQ